MGNGSKYFLNNISNNCENVSARQQKEILIDQSYSYINLKMEQHNSHKLVAVI